MKAMRAVNYGMNGGDPLPDGSSVAPPQLALKQDKLARFSPKRPSARWLPWP